MTTWFVEMGIQLEERWKRQRRDARAFPELAGRILEEMPSCRSGDLEELTAGLLAEPQLPPQINAGESFGQPPITVYRGEGFLIEALFWIDGLVTVHQHAFSGAFSVFTGSSVHCRYRFEEKTRINTFMRLGNIALESAELLTKGTIRPIVAGPSLIHSTFHLDKPTVSIVVRTDGETETGPQFDYRWPNLAIDANAVTMTARKRIQLLRMLARTRPDAYSKAAESVLRNSDFHSAYLVLDQAYALCPNEEDRSRLVAAADLGVMLAVLEESDKRRQAVARRDAASDDELRFFWALLINVPDRKAILDLVKQRYPNEAVSAVVKRCLEKAGFDPPAIALAEALMAGCRNEELAARMRAANVTFKNDFELFTSAKILRTAPGFGALFSATP